ncbi:acyl carrier protein [Streptomyces beigongshangae]|uniref:acyl carrier protein n=1 Tax=Streptomyces beigongshangae TaxID=2841597 RepID=UPI001C858326|nr:acyl carrier protein [Streptomyces sp. REN17]
MSPDVNTLTHDIRGMIADLVQRPLGAVRPDSRLLEDLGLDSLQITELAQKIENAVGSPVDEDLLNAEGTTIARCAEIAVGS